MADVLVFDPTEFEVLETFDFEEEVQRPEATRFYTLDEQLIDFFDKMMPKRKATKFEIKELKQLRDRIRESYQNLVVVTETDYVIDRSRKTVNTSWIHPVYSGFDYEPFSYAKDWLPLFTEQRRNVNYYSRLIKALPSPYKATVDGRMFDRSAMLVNEEGNLPINGLGNYIMTKGVLNDDGTIDTVTVEVPNSADNLKTIGYYLDKRPYELARPMIEHPFLKSNQPGFVKTDMSLVDSYPSLTAILEHAVPVTTDPYGEGRKYLKLYDIKLSQIPWSSWRERFPSVERRDVSNPVHQINFKKENEDKPGNVLTQTYLIPWYPGYDSRRWLSMQVDGGSFISRILLSEANTSGNLAAYPFSDILEQIHPVAQPEICQNLMENFNVFLDSGLYRQTFKKKAGFYEAKGNCIPVSIILQEKSAIAYNDRKVWKESTKHDILAEYQKLLKQFQIPIIADEIKYEKVDHVTQSERRKDILSIMSDSQREPEDKAVDIERIVRDLTLDNNRYYDLADQFVVCSHTLELLRGALGDRFAFYAKWTVSIEGARVCRFCGEEVNKDTFVATKEYDEDGHLTMDYEVLPENSGPIMVTVTDIKKLFNFQYPGESILFAILTILQVVPEELQLLPILQLIRKLTGALKSKAAATRTISVESQELIESVLGIAGAVVLLQTHIPFLIPKRGIGNKPLNISGYPRDSTNPEECFVLNSILTVLKKTLESLPAAFKGGIATGLRAVLRNSKELRSESLRWIEIFYNQFRPLFETARERYEEPEDEVILNTIQLPIITSHKPGEEKHFNCKTSRTTISWSTKAPPNVRQSEPKLQSKIYSSPDSTLVLSVSSPVSFNTVSDKDIRRRIGLGLPSGFPKLTEFVKTADAVSYVTIVSRFLSILSGTSFSVKEQQRFRDLVVHLDIREPTSLVRDIAKGIFFELMTAIVSSAPLARMIKSSLDTDLTLRMIILSEDAAKKEDFELRAKERNFLKASLRSLTDIEREITQRLLELGIADIIISNVDRERFAREFTWMDEEPVDDQNIIDVNRPEEGYAGDRDFVENGDQPLAEDGTQLEVDRGFYGDRGVRDYDDYTAQEPFTEYDDTL